MRYKSLMAACALTLIPSTLMAQWQLIPLDTRAEFRGVSLVGNHVAWASGTRGTVARSTDGGRTWMVHRVPGADTLDLRSIAALDERTAIVAAAGRAEQGQAKLFRTTDGGTTWTQVYSTTVPGMFFDAIAFWDRKHGLVVSDPVDGTFVILMTKDGGVNWERASTAGLPRALTGEAMFAASGTCLTVWGTHNVWIGTGGGAQARVYHSSDRGATWTVTDTPVSAGTAASGIFALAFRDASHGVAVGGDYTQPRGQSTNVAVSDGSTWRAASGPLVNAYLSGVAWADNTTVVAVGLGGTAVSHDNGNSWALIDSLPLNVVRFHGGAFGIAAGPRGRIARWNPGR